MMASTSEGRWSPSSADGAFAAFAKDANRRAASLRRPVSVVAALTAGLEGVITGSGAPGMEGQGVPSGGMQRRFKREASSSSMCPVDDNNGFLVLPGRDGRPLEGDWGGLLGGRYCYKRLIGVGTFAQIIEAEDMLSQTEPKKRVALKVTRAGMQGVGMQESQLLSFLAGSPGFCGANIVEAHAAFALGEHWCLVLELLPGALPDLLRQIRPYSLPMSSMRKLALQLLTSLSFLSSQGVIHADIRPENVLLRDFSGLKRGHGRAPSLKVKLSDLGNSFRVSESGAYHDDFELQTLAYRAPEVLYGLPFDTQIDMWSLGCLLVEVYIGRRLFDAFNRSSAVATMAKTLGPIPRERFSSGRFYSALSSLPVYGTLSVDADGQRSSVPFNQPLISRLTTLLHCEDAGSHSFVSFLAGCLEYDPRHRLTPLTALRHNFVCGLCPLAHFLPEVAASDATRATGHVRSLHTVADGADSGNISKKGWLKVEPASSDPGGTFDPQTEEVRSGMVAGHEHVDAPAGQVRRHVQDKSHVIKTDSECIRVGYAPGEEDKNVRGARRQQNASLVRPQAKHAAESSAEQDIDGGARRASQGCCLSEDGDEDVCAVKGRGKHKGGGTVQIVGRGCNSSGVGAGSARRRVRRAGSSSSSSSEDEGKSELSVAMAVLQGDGGDDDEGEEYVPSSRRQLSPSPQPREMRLRKVTVGDKVMSAELSEASKSADRGDGHDDDDDNNDNARRGSSKGGRAKKRELDTEDKEEDPPSASTGNSGATKPGNASGGAKRQRNLAGLVAPTARLGGAGETGCSFDAEATDRRQSRRANLGSKPNEWWVTGNSSEAAAGNAAASEKFRAGSEAAHDNGENGAARGKSRGRGRGRGSGGRASSVLHSGSSLLFD